MQAAHKDDTPCAVVGVDVAGGEDWFDKKDEGYAILTGSILPDKMPHR